MADDEYDGDEMMGFDDELDWLYVEDEYNLADELAETQFAEPGYPGTNYEINMEEFDYDLYAYYDDLEYGDDSYWEYGIRQDKPNPEMIGQKRKRGASGKAGATNKRRKVLGARTSGLTAAGAEQLDTVLYMGQQERSRSRVPPLLEKRAGYAFLGDWRRRFADKDGVIEIEEMPAAMQQAAEAQDDDTPVKNRDAIVPGDGAEDDEGGWEDEDEDEEGNDIDLSALDPDMLKQILKQKLKDAGLEGTDEGAFMDTLRRMLAGDEDAAAGELANTLLGQATEEEGAGAFSGWLSQQGVSLEQKQEDDMSSVAPDEMPENARNGKSGKKQQSSPPDSAVSGLQSSQASTKDIAMRGASPELKQKKKTVAASGIDKSVANDSTASQQPAAPASDGASSKVARRSAGNMALESSAAEKKIRRSKAERASPSGQLHEELQDDVEVHKAADQSAKPTRKRKAEQVEHVNGEERAERATKEPTTRRTRSARAKGGR